MLASNTRMVFVAAVLALSVGTAGIAMGTDAGSPPAPRGAADDGARAQALRARVAQYRQEAQTARQTAANLARAAARAQAARDGTPPGGATPPAGTPGAAEARAAWNATIQAYYEKVADLADRLAAAAQKQAAFHEQRAAAPPPSR